eukprot:TRINITY_DN2673_c0_g1_i1.p1 TRINITY_DN2673_c0_g1~~TRINITY_DN2673_c0_g1_i1.p1  ORF type:complete len:347 (+),score=163.07 TRINITY_DN2673_c0_g1_i1:74-1042(+)
MASSDIAMAFDEAASLLATFSRAVFLGEFDDTRKQEPRRDAVLLYIFLIYSVGQFLINWGLRFTVIEPAARFLLRRGPKPAKPAHVQKFAQSAVEALTYGVYTVFGLLLVPRQSFFWPSVNWWYIRGATPAVQFHDELICFYILYCSRYVQAGISVLLEHRRKDFVEMMVHHVVTSVLVAISYWCDFLCIGVVIMLLFDPADVPLHCAKLFKYVSEAYPAGTAGKTYNQMVADRLFESFVVVFVLTRIVLFPYTVWSCVAESTSLGVEGNVCIALLVVLQLLQWMWLWMIIKAVINMVRKGKIEDVRSDSEDEAEEAKKKTN